MLAENGQQDKIGTTVTEVSERMSTLVREEIELAKAEMTVKLMSIARGTVAVAAGAVFGVFAVIFALAAIAWGINDVVVAGVGNIWIGFAAVFGVLLILALAAFTFAWRKLRVGPPVPNMAIDEAKKIRETVATQTDGDS
ncbi:MAG TPA: phage holin family protein [Solirubrobacteraceae bacterium]